MESNAGIRVFVNVVFANVSKVGLETLASVHQRISFVSCQEAKKFALAMDIATVENAGLYMLFSLEKIVLYRHVKCLLHV